MGSHLAPGGMGEGLLAAGRGCEIPRRGRHPGAIGCFPAGVANDMGEGAKNETCQCKLARATAAPQPSAEGSRVRNRALCSCSGEEVVIFSASPRRTKQDRAIPFVTSSHGRCAQETLRYRKREGSIPQIPMRAVGIFQQLAPQTLTQSESGSLPVHLNQKVVRGLQGLRPSDFEQSTAKEGLQEDEPLCGCGLKAPCSLSLTTASQSDVETLPGPGEAARRRIETKLVPTLRKHHDPDPKPERTRF